MSEKYETLGQAFWEDIEGVTWLSELVKEDFEGGEWVNIPDKVMEKQLKFIIKVELEEFVEKLKKNLTADNERFADDEIDEIIDKTLKKFIK